MIIEDIITFDEPPKCESTLGWDRHFCEMTSFVASKSKDPSTKVGCVVTYPDHGICSTGFNGFPRGIDDTPERLHERKMKYALTVHAEMNAICNAAKHGHKTDGCIMYLPWFSCSNCAKHVVQCGIKTVVFDKEYIMAEDLVERWKEELLLASQVYREADVKFYKA